MSYLGSGTSHNVAEGFGGNHPGLAPQDFSPITISTGSPLREPHNGMQLMINGSNYEWSRYQNLPAYLTGPGKVSTTVINETDAGTLTLSLPCRAYMMRDPTWNAVDIAGWTLQESAKNYLTASANQSVYYRDFAPGSYTIDNNSAMYIFDFGQPISNVTSSLGTVSVYNPGANSIDYTVLRGGQITGRRLAVDPYNGPVTYSISAGALPSGFSLNAATGQITGTWVASAINTDGTVYNFTVRATGPNGAYTDRAYSVTVRVPFLYRQIITRNYMAGGYQGGSLWSNVNRVTHSNDTSTNLGDGTIDNYHYKSGACGDTYGWIWNGASTTRFNMRTEVKSNATGAPPYSCGNTGTTFNSIRTASYTAGEGSATPFRFTFSTETFTSLSATVSNDHTSGISGEFIGCYWTNAATTASSARINFSTEAWSTATASHAVHGQQKGFNGKLGYGYGSTGGSYNGGTSLNKVNLTTTTDSNVGTITKPVQNQGEDNNGLGQTTTYTIGGYDAVGNGQNNRSGKLILATDTASEIGGALQPGGHVGASSGHCFHRD